MVSSRGCYHRVEVKHLTTLLFAGVLTVLGAGCGSDSMSDGTDRFAGVPVSRELKQHLDRSRNFGDQPSNHFLTQQLDLYESLTAGIQNTATRQAAGDTLYAAWRADPENFLWIDLAAGYNYILRRKTDRNAMYALPALADTSTAVGSFVKGRRFYGYGSRGEHFHRADSLATELNILQKTWLERRLATVESDNGDHLNAVRRLLSWLPQAREAGGQRLAVHLWRDVARFLSRADRLDDALHAVERAEQIAVDIGYHNLEIHCRLTRADIYEVRSEFNAAIDLYDEVIEQSQQLGSSWHMINSLNKAASLFGELGDMEGLLSCDSRNLQQALAANDSLNVPRSMMNVANDYRQAGELDSCLVYQTRARHWVEAYRDKRNMAVFPRLEAEYYLQIGDYAAGDSLLALASDRSRGSGTAVDEAELLLALVRKGLESDQPSVAYRALSRLDVIRPALHDTRPDQNFLAELAIASTDFYGRQGEFHRAFRSLERAEEAVSAGGGEGKLWDFHRCKGELALRRGDDISASRSFKLCLDLADPVRWPARAAQARSQLGRLLLKQGLHTRAAELFAPVSKDSSFGGRFHTRLSSLLYQGMAFAGSGQYETATSTYRRALDLCTPHTPANLVAHLNLELSRTLSAMELWTEAEAALEQSQALAWRRSRSRSLTEVQQVGWDLRRNIVEAMVGMAMDRPGSGPDQREVLSLLKLADGLRSQNSGPWELAKPADSGVIASYFVGVDRSCLWVGTSRGWTLHNLPGGDELAVLAAPVLSDLQDPNRAVSNLAVNQMAQVILEPILSSWQADALLVVVPDGVLHVLPWAVLPLDNERMLIEHGPLVTGATTAAAVHVQLPRTGRPVGRLLAVGVDSDSASDGLQLSTLRQAESEAIGIAKTWQGGDADLRTGGQGDWGALNESELAGYQVIHIASHAVAHAGANGAATLRLAGTLGSEPLTVQTVRGLRLEADLVYLSCCETAGGTAGGGGAVADFAHAFLKAGAGAVVASPFRVDDEASAGLAQLFYQHWQSGLGHGEALRQAQLELMKKEGRRWRHPYYWASYRVAI